MIADGKFDFVCKAECQCHVRIEVQKCAAYPGCFVAALNTMATDGGLIYIYMPNKLAGSNHL